MDQAHLSNFKKTEISICNYDQVGPTVTLISFLLLIVDIMWVGVVGSNGKDLFTPLKPIGLATIGLISLTYLWILLGYWRSKKEVDEIKEISNSNAHQLRKALIDFHNLQKVVSEMELPIKSIIKALDNLDGKDSSVKIARNAVQDLTRMLGITSPVLEDKDLPIKLDSTYIYFRRWLINHSSTLFMKAEKRGVNFTMDLTDDNLPLIIETNPTSLIRVISNLVETVIKRTQPDSERTVSCVVGKHGDDQILVRVSNELNTRSLNVFLSVASKVTDKVAKDLGIEMEIAKNLVDEAGGTTTYYRTGDGDLVISLTIPIKFHNDPVNKYQTVRKLKFENFKTISILIIDGDKERATSMANEISVDLSPQNIEILNFASQTALNKLKYNPALIILDNALPGTSGIEFLQEIKNHPKTKDAIIIASSSSSKELVRQTFLNEGVFAYLQKPIPPDLIKETLQEALAYTIAKG